MWPAGVLLVPASLVWMTTRPPAGTAKLVARGTVEVATAEGPRRLTADHVVLATGRAIIGTLSVEEIYRMFPNLEERRQSQGSRLSGGEQQMLAMARILRSGARLLLLDEISEGLAPVIVQKLGEVIRSLKEKGFTIILVEQNFRFAAPLADRMYIVEHGRIVAEIGKDELEQKQALLHEYLGV